VCRGDSARRATDGDDAFIVPICCADFYFRAGLLSDAVDALATFAYDRSPKLVWNGYLEVWKCYDAITLGYHKLTWLFVP